MNTIGQIAPQNQNNLLTEPDPLALQRALAQRDKQMEKMYGAQAMAQGNYGAAGWAGVAGNLIGGLIARKRGKQASAAHDSFLEKRNTYNKDLQAFKEQREAQKNQQKRRNKLEDLRLSKSYDLDNQKALASHNHNLRSQVKPQPSFQQQQFQQLPPEQQVQARQSMFGVGNQQPSFSPEIQAAVQTGAITPQQAQEAQRQKAIGGGQQSMGADARTKMGLLNDAEKSLEMYKQGAFSADGDYKEIGSKFGNTNNYLNNAVDNLLRFESGASISDDERDQALDKYSPSMWRSDETNMSKIKMLENKIVELRNSLGGQPQQQQGSNFNQANNTFFKYSGGQ